MHGAQIQSLGLKKIIVAQKRIAFQNNIRSFGRISYEYFNALSLQKGAGDLGMREDFCAPKSTNLRRGLNPRTSAGGYGLFEPDSPQTHVAHREPVRVTHVFLSVLRKQAGTDKAVSLNAKHIVHACEIIRRRGGSGGKKTLSQ